MSDLIEPGACPFCAWDHPGDPPHSGTCVIGRHVEFARRLEHEATMYAREQAEARVAELEAALSEASDIRGVVDRRTLQAEARVAELEAQRSKSATLEAHALERAEKAEAERDAERGLYKASMAIASQNLETMEAERDALKAQAEAARATCEGLKSDRYGADSVRWSAATEVLRAMDEAKPSTR